MEPTKEVEALGNQVWWGASTHLELKGQGENGVSTAMGAGDLEDAALAGTSHWPNPQEAWPRWGCLEGPRAGQRWELERHRKGEEIENLRACEDLSEDWLSLQSRGLYFLQLLVRSIYWVQAQSLALCKVRVARIGQAGCAPSDTCLGATFSFAVCPLGGSQQCVWFPLC